MVFGRAKKTMDKVFTVSYIIMIFGSKDSKPHSGAK